MIVLSSRAAARDLSLLGRVIMDAEAELRTTATKRTEPASPAPQSKKITAPRKIPRRARDDIGAVIPSPARDLSSIDCAVAGAEKVMGATNLTTNSIDVRSLEAAMRFLPQREWRQAFFQCHRWDSHRRTIHAVSPRRVLATNLPHRAIRRIHVLADILFDMVSPCLRIASFISVI